MAARLWTLSAATLFALAPFFVSWAWAQTPQNADPPSIIRIAANGSDLDQRIVKAEQFLRTRVTVKLTQNQFDGLVSFALSAPEAFDGPFLAAVNKSDFETATSLMLKYDKVREPKSGRMVVDSQLHDRRLAERNLILHGDYGQSTQAPVANQDEPWGYHCDGDVCTIASQIRNDDATDVAVMRIDFVVDRKAKRLTEVSFHLPPDAHNKTLAFAFAKVRTDASDEHHVELEPGSARIFTIAQCDADSCRVALPNGMVLASKGQDAMDLGAEIAANNQMLVHYPSGKDNYATSVLLSGFKAREQDLFAGSPAH